MITAAGAAAGERGSGGIVAGCEGPKCRLQNLGLQPLATPCILYYNAGTDSTEVKATDLTFEGPYGPQSTYVVHAIDDVLVRRHPAGIPVRITTPLPKYASFQIATLLIATLPSRTCT